MIFFREFRNTIFFFYLFRFEMLFRLYCFLFELWYLMFYKYIVYIVLRGQFIFQRCFLFFILGFEEQNYLFIFYYFLLGVFRVFFIEFQFLSVRKRLGIRLGGRYQGERLVELFFSFYQVVFFCVKWLIRYYFRGSSGKQFREGEKFSGQGLFGQGRKLKEKCVWYREGKRIFI